MMERKIITVSPGELEQAGGITWMNVRVEEMTREEMIGFIGQLDHRIGELCRTIGTLRE